MSPSKSLESGRPPGRARGNGTPEDPWKLKTPSGQSEFMAFRDLAADPPTLVIRAGTTELRYQLRCLDDLTAALKAHGDWMPLGSADEQKPATPGTVEAWGRATDNPVHGLVRTPKGIPGTLRHVRPARPGGARPC